MYKNIKVEAENLELIIENSHGDKAIIPANKRDWVKQKLSEGCHSCIDSLVEILPIASQYAQDGSIYPSVRTTKFDDTTENKYQQWRASLPKNLQYEGDYDLRGFYKENPDFNINDSEQHLTDKWKLPNHPTFSDESVYYKGNENYGGKWKSYDYGDVYTPNNPEVKQQKLEWKKGFYSKDKVVVDGKLYDINTPEYKEIYDKGIGYFDKTGTFISSKEDLPEVTVSSKIQPNTVSSYISEFGKQTPKEEYLQNKSREHEKEFYSAPLWAQQVVGGYNEERKKSDRKRDEEDYNKLQSNFITEKLLNRNKQKDNETRVQWLQRFSDKELEVIKNSDYKSKIEPSIWSKFEQGLLSIVNAGSPVTFKNENLTKEEAKQEDNPLNILQPLSIPTKMVQSAYKDNYSFTDALKGKQNNAGIVEDIVTDPLNLVGLGIWSKLSKANKFKNLDEAYNAIKTLDKVSLEKKLGNTISDKDWEYLYRVQEKGFNIEKPTLKAIEERVLSGNGKWYDHNILNNTELRADMQSRDKYYGQWFDSDPKRLDYYLADKGEEVDILRTKVPKKILEQYRIDKIDPEIAKKWSLSHETEYIVPKDLIQQAEKFDKRDWQKLIDEHERVKQLNKTDDVVKNLPKVENLDKVSEKVITENVVKAGFPNPLTLLTKPKTLIDNILGRNQLEKNASNLYRKIGNKKGLKSLIENEGAISPGYDNVWFAKGSPNEDYNGVFAVELSSDKIGIGKNEISKGKGLRTGYKITNKNNIPLEDLKVYRRRFLSTAYKEIDKTKLANELKTANIQNYIENLWKYGSQGYLLHEFLAHEFPKDFDKWTPKVEKFYKEKIKPASKSIDEYMWNLITKSK